MNTSGRPEAVNRSAASTTTLATASGTSTPASETTATVVVPWTKLVSQPSTAMVVGAADPDQLVGARHPRRDAGHR